MIFYLLTGFVLLYGVVRMFVAILGKERNEERIGSYVNMYVYGIAVLLPFNYIIGVVVFGLGVLFFISLSFAAPLWRRAVATAAVFVVLVGVRAAVSLFGQNLEGLVLHIFVVLVFYVLSSAVADLSKFIKKSQEESQILAFKEKAEEEKNELISMHMQEINSFKENVVINLNTIQKLLDRYKLEDAEVLIKKMIGNNET